MSSLRRMMMAGLKNTSVDPTPNRVINIKLDIPSVVETLAGWNWWNENDDLVLLTDDGTPTDIKLKSGGASWTRDNTPDLVLSNEFFPEGVFKSMVYTSEFAANPKILTLTGLDTAKRYDIRFAVGYIYYDPQDATNVTVNGVTQFLDGVNPNVLYMVEFFNQVPSPSGEILIEIAPTTEAQYSVISAIRIDEHTP